MAAQCTRDPRHGFFHLDPIPDQDFIDNWYSTNYYDLIGGGGRAPELRRILEGGEPAAREIEWLKRTLWDDVVQILGPRLSELKVRPRVLDFGSGTGHFLAHSRENTSWDLHGVEPAGNARQLAMEAGLAVYASLEDYCRNPGGKVDAVVSLNVFEHLPNPEEVLGEVSAVIAPGGYIVIRVPNDFTALQECAQRKLSTTPWWIAFPDHINYFSFPSLRALLEAKGFEMVDELGDFPMELFLLFGDNYVANKELGPLCHQKRVSFEMSIPADLRRSMYRSFAGIGVGRNALVFARKK